jgi:hypothetical protein
MKSPSRLVVRTYAPLRRYFILGSAILLAAMALYAAFEWGRSGAGFDVRSARFERAQQFDRISTLETENRTLRLQLAGQETARVGQGRERTELAKSIGDLQAEVARQAQDLAFYRGVVDNKVSAEIVKIQQFQVTRGAAANQFKLRLVLGRPLGTEDAVDGRVKIRFEGATAATPVNLDLASVSDVSTGELRFNLRYVETFEQQLVFPAGFIPARTVVEVLPTRRGANPIRKTYLWNVENG